MLLLLEIFHIFLDFWFMFYIFFFNSFYDIYYAGLIFAQTIHWYLLKNECILSYLEKKMIDPNYELGSDVYWAPHYDLLNKDVKILKSAFVISTLIFIFFRNNLYVKILCTLSILLWIYLSYFSSFDY